MANSEVRLQLADKALQKDFFLEKSSPLDGETALLNSLANCSEFD